MSRQNKVNPGTYTQAGRLSPDDSAREMTKQREAASPASQDGKAQPRKPAAPRVTEKDKADDEEEPEDSSEE